MIRRYGFHLVIALLVSSIMVFSCIQLIPEQAGSVLLEKFSDGSGKVTITFESAGIDSSSLKIDVPLEASILSASMNISSAEFEGSYPEEVSINAGNDEDNEWEFKGTGFGLFGKQTLFSD
jgi:hypothetical protein